MNKKFYFWGGVGLFGVILALIIASQTFLKSRVDQYVYDQMTEMMGKQPLEAQYESQVRSIAAEMGITQPLIVRKMNTAAMQAFGYHNAFVIHYLQWNFLPLNNQAFMYVSEGFFSDITPEEQRFLIGHELIHAREHHVMFLNLVVWLATWLGLLGWIIVFRAKWRVSGRSQRYYALVIVIPLLVWIGYANLVNLGGLAYRRYIERVADRESMKLLGTYEGCCKFTERCSKEFKVGDENSYGGLWLDHPCNADRRAACLQLKSELEK